MGAVVWSPSVCQTNEQHVVTAWSVEWEPITEGVVVPVLVRRCTLCAFVEYANREQVAA